MQKLKFKPLLLGAFLFVIANVNLHSAENGSIKVTILDVESNEGKLYVYLFDNEDYFPTKIEKAIKVLSSEIKNKKATVVFANVPFGNYAVAIHHDINGNGEVDTNFLGIPNENFGASNNAKGFMGPPSFDDAKFELNESNKNIRISMD